MWLASHSPAPRPDAAWPSLTSARAIVWRRPAIPEVVTRVPGRVFDSEEIQHEELRKRSWLLFRSSSVVTLFVVRRVARRADEQRVCEYARRVDEQPLVLSSIGNNR